MYGSTTEKSIVSQIREHAKYHTKSPGVFAWKRTAQEWQRGYNTASENVYNLCLEMGIRHMHVRGCIGGRLGIHVDTLSEYPSADYSLLVAWTNTDCWNMELDPLHPVYLRDLFGKEWQETCWLQILSVGREKLELPEQRHRLTVMILTVTWK